MNINGITPSMTGDGWFVLDKSGKFSLDEPVWATIYLVGGGSDGTDGYYEEDKKIVHGGIGGDGGYVYKFGKIALFKNIDYDITVAEPNNKSGTSIIIRGEKITCAHTGRQVRKGGLESMINYRKAIVNSQNGIIGILTPIGYVGSSGGGGCAVYKDMNATFGRGGEGAGSGRYTYFSGLSDDMKAKVQDQINAKNYGCGGGGNTFCYNCSNFEDIGLKSKGKGGCVIIVYEPYDEDFPNLTIRYWKKIAATRGLDKNSLEMIEMLQSKYLDIVTQNKELKNKIKLLENKIAQKNESEVN